MRTWSILVPTHMRAHAHAHMHTHAHTHIRTHIATIGYSVGVTFSLRKGAFWFRISQPLQFQNWAINKLPVHVLGVRTHTHTHARTTQSQRSLWSLWATCSDDYDVIGHPPTLMTVLWVLYLLRCGHIGQRFSLCDMRQLGMYGQCTNTKGCMDLTPLVGW